MKKRQVKKNYKKDFMENHNMCEKDYREYMRSSYTMVNFRKEAPINFNELKKLFCKLKSKIKKENEIWQPWRYLYGSRVKLMPLIRIRPHKKED